MDTNYWIYHNEFALVAYFNKIVLIINSKLTIQKLYVTLFENHLMLSILIIALKIFVVLNVNIRNCNSKPQILEC